MSAPVVIVGAGPIGLGAALELARFGVRSVLLERRATTSWHPKTRSHNTRTMEIVRGWGAQTYGELRALDLTDEWKSPIRFARSIVGEELGTIESRGFVGPGPDLSPAVPLLSSQDRTEPVMLAAAERTGLVDVRFGHQLLNIVSGTDEGDDEVAVEVADSTGGRYTLTAPALVAADGAASTVRAQLGVPLDGPVDVAYFVNCYFRADVERYVGDRPGILLFVANPDVRCVLQPLDARGRWLTQIAVPLEQWSTDTYTPQRCAEAIRAAVGVPELEPEILSVGLWKMNAAVARSMVHGRVFLAGDAAHMFPPTGGLGVNTGMQGMHNAVWKIVYHLRGEAGRGLLDTYDTERRPVARWTADQSLHNTWQLAALSFAMGEDSAGGMSPAEVITATRRYGNHLGVELGNVYSSIAVVSDGSTPPPVEDPYSDYVPSGTPGCRAPHLWLGRGPDRTSTLDLFGPRLTLLTGPRGDSWPAAAGAVAAGRAVEIAPVAIDGGQDPDGAFAGLYGLDEDGAVLVRPDGYVAWRAPTVPAEPTKALDDAVAQILSR